MVFVIWDFQVLNLRGCINKLMELKLERGWIGQLQHVIGVSNFHRQNFFIELHLFHTIIRYFCNCLVELKGKNMGKIFILNLCGQKKPAMKRLCLPLGKKGYF